MVSNFTRRGRGFVVRHLLCISRLGDDGRCHGYGTRRSPADASAWRQFVCLCVCFLMLFVVKEKDEETMEEEKRRRREGGGGG